MISYSSHDLANIVPLFAALLRLQPQASEGKGWSGLSRKFGLIFAVAFSTAPYLSMTFLAEPWQGGEFSIDATKRVSFMADMVAFKSLLGPVVSAQTVSALGGVYAKYESDFVKYAEIHWQSAGSKSYSDPEVMENTGTNYYDRAKIYYAFWQATGNPTYLDRANEIAVAYRTTFLEGNNFKIQPHYAQIEGVALHYLVTGDEASRIAVGKLADQFSPAKTGFVDALGSTSIDWMNGRVQARVLEAFLVAEKIDAPSAVGNDWSQLLRTSLSNILSSQSSDGAYHFVNHEKPWMTGMLNEALIDYYENFEADPRIITAVKNANDYLWAHNWIASAQAFDYQAGTGNPVPDSNNIMSSSFGWLYAMTGDATYKQRGDQIFAGGVNKAWLEGSKQFNKEYTTSYEYLGYTLKQPAPTTQPPPSSTQPPPSSTQPPSSGSTNHAPQAVPDSGTAGENETKLFAVLANDLDSDAGDTKTLKAVGQVTVSSSNASVHNIDASSALSIENGQIKFSPDTLFDKLGVTEKATVVLDYTMEDNQHASSQSTLTIQVIGANEATVPTTSPTTTSLRGTNQSDTINGTTIAEQLYGLKGNDSLFGNGGNDRLMGGRHKDLLNGGADRDLLTGGAGPDAFQFGSIQDSPRGLADRITDFSHREGDKLDLSKIDANSQTATDDHFSFIGGHTFSGAAGQLRFSGGMLSGDLNGDKAADFEVQLTNVNKVFVDDIIL